MHKILSSLRLSRYLKDLLISVHRESTNWKKWVVAGTILVLVAAIADKTGAHKKPAKKLQQS